MRCESCDARDTTSVLFFNYEETHAWHIIVSTRRRCLHTGTLRRAAHSLSIARVRRVFLTDDDDNGQNSSVGVQTSGVYI